MFQRILSKLFRFGAVVMERVPSFYYVFCSCVCMLSHSVMSLATPWTVAHQATLSFGILQARILEWVAMPSSRWSSQSRNWTRVSCITGSSLPAIKEAHFAVTNQQMNLKKMYSILLSWYAFRDNKQYSI